jgi:tight adherence protein B
MWDRMMTAEGALLLATSLAFMAGVALALVLAGFLVARFGRRALSLQRLLTATQALTQPQQAAPLRIARAIGLRLPVLLQRLQNSALARALELRLLRAGQRDGMAGLLGLMAGLAIAVAVATRLAGLGAGFAVVAAGLAATAPVFGLSWLAAQRRSRFEAQFPEALDFIARALRAGHGLMAGIGMVARELRDPVAEEFASVFEEVNFGVPLGEALNRMALRVDSRDLDFFVTAVGIQHETGGNLAELLGGLSGTVRERMKLAGKVRALSSEGRLSGVLMMVLPFALGAIMTSINPDYMSLLWRTPEGRQTVAVMLLMMLVGSVWIQALVRIRV